MIFVKNFNSISNQEWQTSDKYPGVRWKFLVDADLDGSKGISCGFVDDSDLQPHRTFGPCIPWQRNDN